MSERDLPPGWVETTLGASIEYGASIKIEPKDIHENDWVLELEDIESGSSKLLLRLTFKERKSKSTKNAFNKGDVLYGKLRPYLNKTLIADQPGYCTTEILPLQTSKFIDNRYLYYWLRHPRFLRYAELSSHGMNMPRLGTEAGKSAPFILSPLAEQKRIADKLDLLLGRLDACRAHLDRVPSLLKRFRQAVLAAATSGRLTQDWREAQRHLVSANMLVEEIIKQRCLRYNRSNINVTKIKNLVRSKPVSHPLFLIPSTWTWSRWDDLSDWITYGFTKPMPHFPDGIPVVTAKNRRDGYIDFTNLEYTSNEAFLSLSEKDKPKLGEILITKDGAIRGRAAIVETENLFCISQSVAVVRFGGFTGNNKYLLRVIQSQFTQDLINQESAGNAIPHISITNFGRFPVPLPPLDEQAEIVRRVEALFGRADRVEAGYQAALARLQKLQASLLAKAFRGELVAQDPNDEPAQVLLERITAQKAATGKPKRERIGTGDAALMVAERVEAYGVDGGRGRGRPRKG